MSDTLVMPEDAIRAKNCYLCENILSVPPIMAISIETEQYKCGRCKNVKCTTYTRNTLFENVARFITHPCTYKNCKEKIPWELVEKHETVCVYRTVQCPIYYQKCQDVIEAGKLATHFNEKHKHNVKVSKEVWNLNTKFDYVFLIVVNKLQFFVYILHLNDLFAMAVLSVDPITKYKKYKVKLSTGTDDECSILYDNQKINRYDERQHCYKCIRGCCESKHHPYSLKNKKSDINVNEFTNKFRKDLITSIAQNGGELKYTLSLISEEPESKSKETGKKNASKDTDDKNDLIRKSIECPICEEYMVAPIYSCKTGHTICNVCKPRLKKCPTCQAELSNSRNFILEQLTENVKLDCQHKGKGCKFTGNTEEMFKHELNCSHKT